MSTRRSRVQLVNLEGWHYGFLDDIDEDSLLSDVRVPAANVCNFPANYLFTFKGAPVSLTQEVKLKVRRIAEVIAEDPKVLQLVIKPGETEGLVSSSPNDVCGSNGQQKVEGDSGCQSKLIFGNVLEKEKPCDLKLFTAKEINDGKISRLEKERRSFWNDIAPKISCHPQYKKWSLQARNGIIDVEWTLRKTELLKVEAEQVIQIVTRDDNSKTSEKEKKINQKLDSLAKIEFERKKTYEKTEDLHKHLKHSGTHGQRRYIEKQIKENETALDNLFTELKSAQNSLEMVIEGVKHSKHERAGTSARTYISEKSEFPALPEEEITKISQSVVDDFQVDELDD